MISTAEIHRAAAREGLRFDQAEKDGMIVLLLSTLAPILESKKDWFFKGGTCLRHCYFPGYRFSEDIDFTCREEGAGLEQALLRLRSAASEAADRTGIRFECREPRSDPAGVQVEIPVEYSRGGARRQALPAVKVHLTFDEPLLSDPESRIVRPPDYFDRPVFSLLSYSLVEIVAEKLRAMLQQQEKWPRPRDLYDLWHILCFKKERFGRRTLRELFQEKCRVRGLPPDPERLRSDHLQAWNRAAWRNQLAPLLKSAPDYDAIWSDWRDVCDTLF
ncbi:MAG: nucleotidyl transferase AbiEii/AbiGii toxin family protein [Candidatus Aminicenantes bacterium]|nr:nucleotidyl transferase AbiEii/AbiGii toxin family protein [Candidatus Aminicenantes bacterium]